MKRKIVAVIAWLAVGSASALSIRAFGPLFGDKGVLTFVETLAISLLWWAAVAALAKLPGRVRGTGRSTRSPWSHTLLVNGDVGRGAFAPSVWVRGGRRLKDGKVRLELVDEHGVVRAVSEASLPASAMGKEIHLPPVAAPEGARVDEVLRWRWDVSVRARRRVRARWREYLVAANKINAEGELVEIPELAEAPGRTSEAGTPAADRTEPPIAQLVDVILVQGLIGGASDIRIVPRPDCIQVKHRVNGGYRIVMRLPRDVERELHSRLQETFGLPRERGVAQRDGARTVSYQGREVRFEGRSIPADPGDIFHIRLHENDGSRAA